MALREHEGLYLQVVQRFLHGHLSVDDFVLAFMDQWRDDRDAERALLDGQSTSAVQSDEFTTAVDQAFTACDCFSHEARNEFEISEAQLRHELQQLFGKVLGEARAL